MASNYELPRPRSTVGVDQACQDAKPNLKSVDDNSLFVSKEDVIKTEDSKDQIMKTEMEHGTGLEQMVNYAKYAETLKAGVRKGLDLLDSLGRRLSQIADGEDRTTSVIVRRHIRRIKETQMMQQPRIVVGICGTTGAGKSYMLNALLDQEFLLPTSCTGACTAAVTSISFNYDTDPNRAYGFFIDFIDKDSWRQDIELCLNSSADENAITYDGEELQIARQKLSTVYSGYSFDQITRMSVEELLNEETVRPILGESVNFWTGDSKSFQAQLAACTTSASNHSKESTFWPLIKEVRVYVKADILSTGVVLVDLPGVQDANPARERVARNYMLQCSRLWIVAEATRAVDNKTRKELMGEHFRRQLKIDGSLDKVTFICSKIDDLAISEVVDKVSDANDISVLRQVRSELDRDLESSKDNQQQIANIIHALKKQLETTESQYSKASAIVQQHRAAQTASGSEHANKRKHPMSSAGDASSHKKIKMTKAIGIGSVVPLHHSGDQSGNVSARVPIQASQAEFSTEQHHLAKIDKMKSKIDNTLEKIKRHEDRLAETLAKIAELVSLKQRNQASIYKKCVAMRSFIIETGIREDFLRGVREIDRNLAAEAMADGTDATAMTRDYDALGDSLQVFCVCSRAYQKLQGRELLQKLPLGFDDVHDTGIPSLQSHCKQLPKEDCRFFLRSVSTVLNSLKTWASPNGRRPVKSKKRKENKAWYREQLEGVENDIDKLMLNAHQQLVELLKAELFSLFPAAVLAATKAAPQIATGWHRLPWMTYRAVVRRLGGPFTGSSGTTDFNADLANELFKSIDNQWESAFARKTPDILQILSVQIGNLLDNFHDIIKARLAADGGEASTLFAARVPTRAIDNALEVIRNQIQEFVSIEQRKASRRMGDSIKSSMKAVYDVCKNEDGKGFFKRVKQHMDSFMGKKSKSMFTTCVSSVKAEFGSILDAVLRKMQTKKKRVMTAVTEEYAAVVIGEKRRQIPAKESQARDYILGLIDNAHKQFGQLLTKEDSFDKLEGIKNEDDIKAEHDDLATSDGQHKVKSELDELLGVDDDDQSIKSFDELGNQATAPPTHAHLDDEVQIIGVRKLIEMPIHMHPDNLTARRRQTINSNGVVDSYAEQLNTAFDENEEEQEYLEGEADDEDYSEDDDGDTSDSDF